MTTKFKIIFGIGAFFLVILVGFIIVQNLSSPAQPTGGGGINTTTPGSGTLPDYILSGPEEVKIKEFVKNFVNLYNTYSSNDISNLTALGDYQTIELQKKTVLLVENLQNSLPVGYSLTSQADMNTFAYKYPDANTLRVTVKGRAEEYLNENVSAKNYIFTAELELQKNGNSWLVQDIKIIKN